MDPDTTKAITELSFATLTRLSEAVAMVRCHRGIEMTGAKAREAHQVIGEIMPGNYGLLVDRHPHYSLDPLAVFEVLNQVPRLKAIAIVVHSATTAAVAKIDTRLSQKPLAIFDNIPQAQNWLEQQLGKY